MGGFVRNSLEGVWQHREERLLPELFGEKRNGIFVLEGEIFTDIFEAEDWPRRLDAALDFRDVSSVILKSQFAG
jgi:hypothetical protein